MEIVKLAVEQAERGPAPGSALAALRPTCPSPEPPGLRPHSTSAASAATVPPSPVLVHSTLTLSAPFSPAHVMTSFATTLRVTCVLV